MYALLSVFDKTGIVDLATNLIRSGHRIISTGGTYALLQKSGIKAEQVSSITKYPEILGGRVKTLHPTIFGGILSDRNIHQKDIRKHGLLNISVVVANLYPFWNVSPGTPDAEAIEEIDVGGVALIRAAAKNFSHVSVLTQPAHYKYFDDGRSPDLSRRRVLAQAAFALTAAYDTKIANHFAIEQDHLTTAAVPDRFERTRSTEALSVFDVGVSPPPLSFKSPETDESITRVYTRVGPLKYGCNPHQSPAGVYRIAGEPFPFRLIHGSWSYINVLDAINAWSLVSELGNLFGGCMAAASFKHTSPAGAAIDSPSVTWNNLSEPSKNLLSTVYGLTGTTSKSVLTYARARNADPQSSFGDFIGFNCVVDEELASFISDQISDGIVAPGFTGRALEILMSKKKGTFLIIEAKQKRSQSFATIREIGGLALCQPENARVVDRLTLLANVPTKNKSLPDTAIRDLMFANACMKYAQSNNVACAFEGQLVGIASGQQSRIDAVKLMSDKVATWLMRHNQELIEEYAKANGPRQQKIMDITAKAADSVQLFGSSLCQWKPELAFASDAFIPFSDNIEEIAKLPVKYISQAGGSMRDSEVIEVCNKHDLVMSLTGTRIFTH